MAAGTSVKVAVVGAGSIGQRHQQILKQLNSEVFSISANSPSADFKFLDEALQKQTFDYVVIASQTSQHFSDITCLLENKFSGRVLIEKPLFDKNQKLGQSSFQFSAVGYNLRFHPAFIWLKSNLEKLGTITSANLYVGQYLPTWRPAIAYQNSSSAKLSSGGGVLRDLSHELDMVQNLFGDWRRLVAMGGKFSDLEIETEDTCSVMMENDCCIATTVSLNYLDQIKQRSITINGDSGTISVDFISGIGKLNNTEKTFTTSPDATYLAQHRAVMNSDATDTCSLSDGLKVVQMIDAMESSIAHKKWVLK